MKIVVQRVQRAKVTVNGEVSGSIQKGLLLFAGFHESDDRATIEWICNKVLKLRIFEDSDGKMNLSVTDTGGGILVISQFTLYGNVSKGTRPSFIEAAKPDKAEPLYNETIRILNERSDLHVESGEFGAMMDIELINDGPVTILIEK